MSPRDTGTGAVLDAMVLPALIIGILFLLLCMCGVELCI